MKRTKEAGDVTDPALQFFIIRRLRTIARLGLAVALVIVVGTSTVVYVGYQQDQTRCHDQAANREAIHELISVAIGDIDRDGEPDQAAPDYTAVLQTSEFQALEPDDQAFWTLILAGTADNGPTTTERLQRFAAELADIDC